MFANLGEVKGGGSYWRKVEKSITLVANNTTASITGLTVTGSVWVRALWGQVTTALSSNNTKCHFRTNDQTATIDLSEAATGLTMSSYGIGSLCLRTGQVDVALTGMDNSAARVTDGGNDWLDLFTGFGVQKKLNAVTTIDFRHTCNNQSSGVILLHAYWLPLTTDGNLA